MLIQSGEKEPLQKPPQVSYRSASLRFRHPSPGDGSAIWELVRDTQVLDVNSCYTYLLLFKHFAQTCLLAEMDGRAVGFVTAYVPPERPDVLFVWQIGVEASARQRGVARGLLRRLLQLPCCEEVRYLETTISPSNEASKRLFSGLARKLGAKMQRRDGFAADLFPEQQEHESEPLYRIGPIKSAA